MKEEIARERVEILLKKAEQTFRKDKVLSRRYVSLARKVAMRARYRLPREVKRGICKECDSLLKPGVNCTVRADSKTRAMVYRCECGSIRRYRY